MAGEVDAFEPDDSVSDNEEQVSIFSSTESFGAGIVVLLGAEGSENGLESPWKSRSILLCRSLNVPIEFSFSTLNIGISGIGCDLIIYGSASHRSASVCLS